MFMLKPLDPSTCKANPDNLAGKLQMAAIKIQFTKEP